VERLRAVVGSAFLAIAAAPPNLFEPDVDIADLERGEIVINTFAGDDKGFIHALQQIIGGHTGAEEGV
jgi:hypothetical protein